MVMVIAGCVRVVRVQHVRTLVVQSHVHGDGGTRRFTGRCSQRHHLGRIALLATRAAHAMPLR